MAGFDLTIRLAGENGEGLLTVGDQLAVTMCRMGMNVYTFQNLPAEIKGGASMAQVRIGDSPVLSPGDRIDILEVWNQENYELHIDEANEETILLYDPKETTPDSRMPKRSYPVPLDRIAREEVESIRSKNVVAWSIFLSILGVSKETAIAQFHRSRWARRKDSLESNLKAIEIGYRHGAELAHGSGIALSLPERTGGDDSLILSGNTAIGMGAIAAGCRYYGGYPITPASDIMEFLAKHLPRFGGVVLQTEDEIAALASVIGASFAGKKSMTATSGPGLSLMVEEIGLATMQELPLVIVNAQRGGPSTGLPTKPEQSDLDLAVYGRHGDAPRVVVAPTDVEDCFYTTIRAFNLAEKYQTPVVLLTDQHLSHRSETVAAFDTNRVPVIHRLTPIPSGTSDAGETQGNGASGNGANRGATDRVRMSGAEHSTEARYDRYAFTESGISAMAIPGIHDTPYVATGLEHNDHAHIDYSPRMHERMTEKRFMKIGRVADEPGWVEEFGSHNAALGVIAWGSTRGPLLEAVQRLEERGHRVRVLIPRLLSPLPRKPIEAFLEGVERVAVIELNARGQLASMLQAEFCRPVLRYNKVAGLPFLAIEIERYLEGVLTDVRS